MSKSDNINMIKRSLLGNKQPVGQEKIELSNSTVKTLTLPQDNVKYALLVLEAETPGSFSNETTIARITFDGTTPVTGVAPSSGTGVPMGNLDSWDIEGYNALNKFQIILTENVSNTYLHVNYFA